MSNIILKERMNFPLSTPLGRLSCGAIFGIGSSLYIKTSITGTGHNIRGINLETGDVSYLSSKLHVIEIQIELKILGAIEDNETDDAYLYEQDIESL